MKLLLIWKQPISRRRYKIGILTCNNDDYTFNYSDEIDDAIREGFICFPGFEDIKKTYTSKLLFPNIASRLPNKKRPDYNEILKSYNLKENATDLEILIATKGKLVTDNYEFVRSFNKETIEFDVVGTRHCETIEKSFDLLKVGESVDLILDKTNEHDKYAIQILIDNYHIGFVPRYYSKELSELLKSNTKYDAKLVTVNFENALSDEVVILVVNVKF